MKSPFMSWCYNCNAYRHPDLKFRWAPTPAKGQAKTPLRLEYKVICPSCKKQMVIDKKIRAVMNLCQHQLTEELKAHGYEGAVS